MPSQRAFELKGMTNEQVEKEVDKAVGEHFPHVRILGPTAVWPLVASKANQWVGQRSAQQSWALLGDSAHTVHPLAGMGLNLGLADVAQMLEILEIRAEKEYWRKLNDLSLLRRYERSRKADILAPWLFCDAMQQLFSHPNTMVRSLRNLGLTGVQRLNFIKTFFLQQAGSTT
jgi:2-polyprenyl-6-methoxyphenol hydroxylase-like FAD-dependent oxidoreductase